MIKKTFYQNSKYAQELIQTFESDFVFGEKTVNRIKISKINVVKKDQLVKLSERINSIEDCSLKMNSKNIVMGDGNVDGSIMLIGEAPGLLEDKVGKPFQGDVGSLLNKMLLAINIKRDKIHIRAVEMTEATEFPAKPSKWKCKWCYFGKQNMCRERYVEY